MGFAVGASRFYGQWRLGVDSWKLALKAVVSSVKSNWMLLVAEQQGVRLQVDWQGGQQVGYQQASFCDTKIGVKLVWSIGGATRRG